MHEVHHRGPVFVPVAAASVLQAGDAEGAGARGGRLTRAEGGAARRDLGKSPQRGRATSRLRGSAGVASSPSRPPIEAGSAVWCDSRRVDRESRIQSREFPVAVRRPRPGMAGLDARSPPREGTF
jgi:hypothetical protein